MEEEWRPINGFEGFYEISSFGRIKSLSRNVKDTRAKNKIRRIKCKILKSRDHNSGYISTHLKRDGLIKDFLVHRIVAETYIPNPNSLKQVNHKNGNKKDNRVDNLEWISNRDNVIHRYKMYGKILPLGVTKVTNGYRATIVIGRYDTPEEAHSAYMKVLSIIQEPK